MKCIYYLVFLMLFGSCYKKMDYSENDFTNNVYDENYAGGKWFNVSSITKSSNPSNLNVYFNFRFKDGLLPYDRSKMIVSIDLPGYTTKVLKFYEKNVTFRYHIYNPPKNKDYCFTVSVCTSDTNEVAKKLHPYTDCITYE